MTSMLISTDDDTASIRVGIPIPIGAGEANTLVNAGQGVHESIVATPAKDNEALRVQGLRAGAGITITPNAGDQVLEIASTVGSPGDVTGPASSTLNAPAVFADTTGKLLKNPDAALDMATQNVTNVGTVDGRDVSADGSTLDTHVADTGNPHSTTAVQVGADPAGSAAAVQSNLDTHVADTGNPHSTTAVQVGADPAGSAASAVATHESTFAHANLPTTAEKAALAGTGTPGAGNPYVNNDDSRLSDARTPTGAASGDLAGTYPSPTVPHVILTNNPHSVTAGQVGAIPAAEKGAPNGVATLDGSATVPLAELPDRAKSRVFKPADAAARLALPALEADEAEQQDDSSQWLYDGAAWIQRAAPGGDVAGPALSGDNEISVFDGATGKAIKRPDAPISANGQNITSVGTVDGRSVSTDGAKLDGIEAGAKDDQTITAGTGLTGGGTGDVALAVDFGVGAGQVTEGNDSRLPTQAENDALQGTAGAPGNTNRYVTNSDARLSDARTPTAHASTHETGGGDEVGTATPGASAIVKSNGGGTLNAGWIDDASHGNRGGGPQHAASVASVGGLGGANGFITAQDKEKLDGIDSGATDNQQINAGSGLTGGGSGDVVTLNADFGVGTGQITEGDDARLPTQPQNDALDGTSGAPSGANRYVTDGDPRNTDSRAPTGAASGQLAGTYPAPTVVGMVETSGPTAMSIGAVGDGQALVRVGSTIVGQNVVLGDRIVQVSANDSTAGYLQNKVQAGIALLESVVNPGFNEELKLDVSLGVIGGTAAEGNDLRFPTAAEKSALAGTDGAPGAANRYVTNSDPRNTDSRTPTNHATTHQNGGADEINVAGLSGLLADPQTPATHASTHQNGGADEISVAGLSGALADPQTPTSHASSHQNGGSDEIATATAGANAIPKANAGGAFNAGWVDDTAHGNRGGGSLHANATTSVAGFMSSADKTKLDGVPAGVSSIVTFGASNVAANTVTRYLWGYFSNNQAQTTAIQISMPRAGTLKNMFINQNAGAGNGESIVYTIRVNSVATSITVSIASTAVTGSDTTNSASVSQGDVVDIEVTKALAIGSSPGPIYATIEFE